jgi:dsRNA-specific ribonuclease
VQIKFKDTIISEGTGTSQEEAKRVAASQACQFLGTTSILQEEGSRGSKNYRTLLKEFFELSGLRNYKLSEPALFQDVYNCQIEMESTVVATGTGSSKADAREDAAKKAFLYLRRENGTKYSPLLQLFLLLEGLDRCEFNNITSCQTFIYRVIDGDKIISEGTGLSGAEAKENAAREAYFRLIHLETEKAEYREKLKRGERSKPSASRVSAAIKLPPLEQPKLSLTSVSARPILKQNTEVRDRKKAIRKRPGKAAQSQEKPKLDERTKPSAPKLPSPPVSIAGKQPSFSAPNLSQSPISKKSLAKQIPKSISDKKSDAKKPSSTSDEQ